MSVAAITAAFLLGPLSNVGAAGGPISPSTHSFPGYIYFAPESQKKSMLEARVGYMWGVNAQWFRDGDNANTPSGKKEVSLESIVFGVQGETRRFENLALRAQAWINIPQASRGDFLVDRAPASGVLTARSWETESLYFATDIAAIYHLGPFGAHINRLGNIGMPYRAGLVAGYRYNNFDFTSHRTATPSGNAEDHFHVHIPYLGVHYSNEDFGGSLVRLDMNASPLILARLDGERNLPGQATEIEGQSVTGFWFESLFSWSWPVSDGAFFGVFVKYNYQELSGGATVKQVQGGVLNSTRFSLDGITHMAVGGVTGVVTF